MASNILPPNGQQHCEQCGKRPESGLQVRYDPEAKRHLCSWCWASTPPAEPRRRT